MMVVLIATRKSGDYEFEIGYVLLHLARIPVIHYIRYAIEKIGTRVFTDQKGIHLLPTTCM
jgi:hypothetical protein